MKQILAKVFSLSITIIICALIRNYTYFNKLGYSKSKEISHNNLVSLKAQIKQRFFSKQKTERAATQSAKVICEGSADSVKDSTYKDLLYSVEPDSSLPVELTEKANHENLSCDLVELEAAKTFSELSEPKTVSSSEFPINQIDEAAAHPHSELTKPLNLQNTKEKKASGKISKPKIKPPSSTQASSIPINYYESDKNNTFYSKRPNNAPIMNQYIISAGVIYWSIYEEGLTYASSGFGVNAPKGEVFDVCWEWDPGLKVGLGIDFGCSLWDVNIEYTWLHTNQSETKDLHLMPNSDLVSCWNINNKFHDQLQKTFVCWDTQFNNLHLDLGRYFCCFCDCLTMKLLLGVQGSWIDQNYNLNYTDSSNDIAYFYMTQDFYGVGPSIGLDTSWTYCKNYSLFGDLGFASLWSSFNVSRRDSEISSSHINDNLINTCHNFWTIDPVFSMRFGIRGETCICRCYRVQLEVSWEGQIWLDHNQFITCSTVHRGDLILQGLNVFFRFYF